MPIGSGDTQFWLKAANEVRVTAETMGDADSAARPAMLAIAAEYEAIAKRAYSAERGSSGEAAVCHRTPGRADPSGHGVGGRVNQCGTSLRLGR